MMNEDFDMDTGEDFGYNSEEGFNDSDSLEYNSEEQYEEDKNSEGLKKQTIFIVIAGIAIVIIALSIWRIGKSKTSSKSSAEYIGIENNVNKKDENAENYNKIESNGWTEIDGQQDIGNISKIEATYTVTDIKHVARSNGNEMEVATRLKGSISGFTGTYEVEIPYSKGIRLNIGDTFNVTVNVGEHAGKTVVDGIEY